jgi:SAM-dependent methyltransferase
VIGQRVIGIDTSPAMLKQARARAAEAGVELDLREGDMTRSSTRRAGGIDPLPVPRAPAPADVE